MTTADEAAKRGLQELDDVFDDLEALLKNPDVAGALSERGVNISLALTGADGLRSYLHGDKPAAIEDLSMVAEEIALRAGLKARS
jgi:hypothetical protein